jgi:hypothetical protein
MYCTRCHGRLIRDPDKEHGFYRLYCLLCGRARYYSSDGHDITHESDEALKHSRPCCICGTLVSSSAQSKYIYCSPCRYSAKRRTAMLTERLLSA